MTYLEECRDCGDAVSPNARLCPGCGADRPTGRAFHSHQLRVFLWTVGIGLLVIGLLFWYGYTSVR